VRAEGWVEAALRGGGVKGGLATKTVAWRSQEEHGDAGGQVTAAAQRIRGEVEQGVQEGGWGGVEGVWVWGALRCHQEDADASFRRVASG
jgi:hypothetical protein